MLLEPMCNRKRVVFCMFMSKNPVIIPGFLQYSQFVKDIQRKM